MNPSLLPTLQKLHEEATQGPWLVNGRYIGVTNHASFIGECKDANQNWCNDRMSVANARLIATVRTLLPAIISSLQGAEEMREALGNLEVCRDAIRDTLSDSAKYPQLRLHKMHQDRLERALRSTSPKTKVGK